MFCRNCGEQLEEGWRSCPKCGIMLVGEEKPEAPNVEKGITMTKIRKELKEELIKSAFTSKGSVVLFYGASGISKDLEKVLLAGEEIIRFYHAYRNSAIGYMKSFRMFRDYMVCTDRRLIYIETGRMAFSLLAFLRKVVACPYHEVSNVQPGKRVGIYSGKVLMECNGRKMNYAMMDSKDAEELADFLTEMRR